MDVCFTYIGLRTKQIYYEKRHKTKKQIEKRKEMKAGNRIIK
jgi:hypothetical protein